MCNMLHSTLKLAVKTKKNFTETEEEKKHCIP